MIDIGLMFSVGVEILHSDHIRDIAAAIPPDQLLTETDNPGGPRWLTGDDGQPALIGDIVNALAKVRNRTRHELVSTVHDNISRLREIDDHLRPWLSHMTFVTTGDVVPGRDRPLRFVH